MALYLDEVKFNFPPLLLGVRSLHELLRGWMGDQYHFRFDLNDLRDGRFVEIHDLGHLTGTIISWQDRKVGFLYENENGEKTWKTILDEGTAWYLKDPFGINKRC
jgi:hypothetical protein